MAKGVGMILVILGHYYYTPHIDFIYLFHMPLFFFLSGIFFKKDLPFGPFIISKFKGLIVPYLFFRICASLFDAIFVTLRGNRFTETFFLAIKRTLILDPDDPTWFLIALFLIQLLIWLLVHFIKNKYVIAVIASVFAVLQYLNGSNLPCQLDEVAAFMIYFFVGWCVGSKELFTSNGRRVVIAALSLSLLCLCYALQSLSLSPWLGCALNYLAGSSGIVMTICICHLFNFSSIRYIGSNSIIYLGFHIRIMANVIWDALYLLHWNGNEIHGLSMVLYSIVTMILLFSILYVITRIMTRRPFCFLIGKK